MAESLKHSMLSVQGDLDTCVEKMAFHLLEQGAFVGDLIASLTGTAVRLLALHCPPGQDDNGLELLIGDMRQQLAQDQALLRINAPKQ